MEDIEKWEEANAEAFEYFDTASQSASSTVKQLEYEEEIKSKRKRKIDDNTSSPHDLENSKRPKHIPVPQDFIGVTSFLGRRVLISLQPEERRDLSSSFVLRKSTGLLSTPISFLIESVSQQKLQEASDKLEESLKAKPKLSKQGIEQCELWVDKYSPQRFTDLLSNEQTNREILRWLKSWDPLVFGKTVPATQTEKAPKSSKKTFSQKMEQRENDGKTERDGRPQMKAVLLCGPPGIGKTTLAHIVARHAGYNVIEINASDDRSFEIFSQKVLNSVEMDSTKGGVSKPNCVIIDEIDGEAEESLNFLCELLRDNNPLEKSRGQKRFKLRRPIICICNNQYAPTLRKLKTCCLVHSVEQPRVESLSQRIKEVCKQENLNADSQALKALCELNDCDIRSCLNTLQFLKAQRNYVSAAQIVNDSSVGHKDISKNLFQIWKQIFQTTAVEPRNRNKQKHQDRILLETLGYEDPSSSTKSTFESLMENLETAADMPKVVAGCYENFLSVHLSDPMMSKTTNCLEWMMFFDEMDKQVQQFQRQELRKFHLVIPLAYHKLCSSSSTPNLVFPKAASQQFKQQNEITGIIQSFLLELPAKTLVNLSKVVVSLDLISNFLVILQPGIRPVNYQVLNMKEKQELNRVVSLLAQYKVQLKQNKEKEPLESNLWVFVPPIDKIATYAGQEIVVRPQLLPVHCELIASELRKSLLKTKASLEAEKKPQKPQQLDEITRQANYHTAKDFFGRPITATPTKNENSIFAAQSISPKQSLSPPKNQTANFHYKFHEGFSNAVRRTVFMKDLL